MSHAQPQPLVSVVMPAYNAASYIDEAIASVLNQTFSGLELLVVDDGSQDDTPGRIAAWSSRDPRVIPMRQPNRGISAARNVALARSRGRYIALLDSDDAWETDFLEWQLAVFARQPDAGVVTSNVIHHGGSHDGEPMWPPVHELRALQLIDLLADETSVCIMSVLRREVYDAIGGFDVNLRCNEDYHFWLRAAHAGFTIVQSPRPLGRYRRRPDSVSADQGIMLDGIMRVLREMRARHALGAEECRVIDHQLRRFERERCVLEGKLALLGGRFDDAASAFAAAGRLCSGYKLTLVTTLCRLSPRLLRTLYRMRPGGAA